MRGVSYLALAWWTAGRAGSREAGDYLCYAGRYADLREAMCPEGVCDEAELRLHYERVGQNEGRRWTSS